MRVQKIEGLESLPPDDLTPEEIGQIEIAKEDYEIGRASCRERV